MVSHEIPLFAAGLPSQNPVRVLYVWKVKRCRSPAAVAAANKRPEEDNTLVPCSHTSDKQAFYDHGGRGHTVSVHNDLYQVGPFLHDHLWQ